MQDVMSRRFFEADPTAACLAGPDGTVGDANPAFATLFGFAQPVAARTARLETLLNDAAAWRRAAGEAADGASPAPFEVRGRSMDGQPLHLVCHVASSAEPGRAGELLCWFVDVGASRKLEQELAQHPRTTTGSRIVRGIGHDIGNMMMVVRGFTEVLTKELPEGGRGRAWLAQVRGAADRAAALGEELLAAARPVDPEPKTMPVAELLAGCLPAARRLAGLGVAVEAAAAPADLHVVADRSQLEDAMLALVALALRRLPEGSGVVLEADGTVDDGACLRVRGAARTPAWELRLPAEPPR